MQKDRTTTTSQPPDQLADAEARRQWIYQNRTRLVHQALDGYRTGRRGALVVHPLTYDTRTHMIDVMYLSDRAAQASGRGWPTHEAAAMVRSYNPANECVVVMLHLNGSAISFRLRFTKRV